jgi:hypothetical protein
MPPAPLDPGTLAQMQRLVDAGYVLVADLPVQGRHTTGFWLYSNGKETLVLQALQAGGTLLYAPVTPASPHGGLLPVPPGPPAAPPPAAMPPP